MKTQAEIQAVAAEIAVYWGDKLDAPIVSIEHLYELQDEVYIATLANGWRTVYVREYGKLHIASGWTYSASDEYADKHESALPPTEEEIAAAHALESEARDA